MEFAKSYTVFGKSPDVTWIKHKFCSRPLHLCTVVTGPTSPLPYATTCQVFNHIASPCHAIIVGHRVSILDTATRVASLSPQMASSALGDARRSPNLLLRSKISTSPFKHHHKPTSFVNMTRKTLEWRITLSSLGSIKILFSTLSSSLK